MATYSKVGRPEAGPDSYEALDREILAGFVNPAEDLPFGQRKVLAGRLRMRMMAASRWVADGRPTLRFWLTN